MSQGSFNPKIRFLGQKVCPVARGQTDRRFQEFFLQPIIKDQPKNTEDTRDGMRESRSGKFPGKLQFPGS